MKSSINKNATAKEIEAAKRKLRPKKAFLNFLGL